MKVRNWLFTVQSELQKARSGKPSWKAACTRLNEFLLNGADLQGELAK